MIEKIKNFLTTLKGNPRIFQSRRILTMANREMNDGIQKRAPVYPVRVSESSSYRAGSKSLATDNRDLMLPNNKGFVNIEYGGGRGNRTLALTDRFEKIKLFLSKKPEIQKEIPDQVRDDTKQAGMTARPITDTFCCPYCQSKNFVRRGLRVKIRESVQLYLCKDCGKTFTPHSVRGKHYPLATIFDAISLYNLGYSLEESCRRINLDAKKRAPISGSSFNVGSIIPTSDTRNGMLSPITDFVNTKVVAESGGYDPQPLRAETCIERSPLLADSLSNHENSITSFGEMSPATLSNWITEFKEDLPFLRMRDFATSKYKPSEMIITATLAHRQLYRFRFHRAKCQMLMQENFHHRLFAPLVEFLEMVPGECPHQYFQDGERASETPLTFSKTAMIVRGKTNYATKLAAFVLQGAKERKNRHEILQKFMLYNDSVTVATEVPVYLTRDDLEHMRTQLGFEIYEKKTIDDRKSKIENEGKENLSSTINPQPLFSTVNLLPSNNLPKLITGHIDFVQIRNGMIHLLDFKPNAEKERPIEQLTLYAMALSRLTGLRLFEFKCAWFDEKDYFEFYPLHVLHKPKKAIRRRKVETDEGTYLVNKNSAKIENIRPVDSGPGRNDKIL